MASSEVTAAASFALSLLRTSPSPRSSFVLSPFSLAAALAMLHEGASDDGKDELTQLLLKGHSADEVAVFYSELTSSLSSADGKEAPATTANRLYVDQAYPILDEYRCRIQEKFGADVETVSFGAAEAAAANINSFVEEKTNNKIKDLVKAEGIADAVAALINAVHFKESWKVEFDKENTQEGTFYGLDGERNEPFMRQRKVPARFGRAVDVTSLALEYKDTAYSMLMMMPEEGKFEEFRESLTAEKLLEIISQLRKTEVDVSLPKFTIESSLDGAASLRALGVSAIFDKPGSLSGISGDGRLKVSDIIHKAVIEVNEVGTEAAAATAVVMLTRCAISRPSFRADRPFLYAVLKDDTHVLFLGQYC